MGEPTLFDNLTVETTLPAEGFGESGAHWFVYEPEYNQFWEFPPDLAARYMMQGCLVALASPGDKGLQLRLPYRRDQFPAPDPDKPPFDAQDIVWAYQSAQFMPEVYGRKWEIVADWLRSNYRHPRPEDFAENLAREIGRWAGATDLEKSYMDDAEFDWRTMSLMTL